MDISLLSITMGRRGKKGRFFEYRDERNADLLRVFKECILSTSANDSMSKVYCKMVSQKSRRFWVSEEQATKVVSYMIKGGDIGYMNHNKQKMFTEIHKRVIVLQNKYPRVRLYLLVEEVVSHEAPCFYITPESAKVIISQIKTKCYEQKLRSLPFLR